MAAGYRHALSLTTGGLGSDKSLFSTVGITFGGTYGLKGDGPLTSTISLSIGSSGSFLGAGSLIGAVSFSITPTGTLLGLGVLTGSTSLTFGVSPTISGSLGFFSSYGTWFGGMGYPEPQSLQSSIPVSISVVGGITGVGPLDSTIPLAFDVQSHQPPGFASLFAPWLGGGADAGAFVGSVVGTFSVTGAFPDVPGYMNGLVPVSFTVTTSGSTSTSSLQGRFRSPLMHPGMGPWHPGTFSRRRWYQQARPIGDLVGLVPLSMSSFGAFSGSSGTLSSSVPMSFSVAGTALDAGTLSSSIPMLFTTSGQLSGDGALATNSTITFNLSGSITDPGAMTGSIPMQIGAQGSASGEGALSADMPMLFTVRGSFPSVWRPVNTGHGTIWKPIKTR